MPKGRPKLSSGTKLCRTAFKSVWKVPAVGFSHPDATVWGNGLRLFVQLMMISRIFLETLGIKGLKAESMRRSHTARGFLVSAVDMPV